MSSHGVKFGNFHPLMVLSKAQCLQLCLFQAVNQPYLVNPRHQVHPLHPVHPPLFLLQSRFIVTVVGLNKAVMPTQHESIAIWVLDKDTLKTHEFIIERVPGLSLDHSSRFSLFSQFAASQRVLDSIQCAINNMLSISASESTQTEMDSIPLLPLTNGPHDRLSTPSLTPTTPLSLTDTITSSLL